MRCVRETQKIVKLNCWTMFFKKQLVIRNSITPVMFFSKQELQWYFGWYLVIRNEQLAWVFAGLYQGIGVSSMAELPTTVGHQMTNKHRPWTMLPLARWHSVSSSVIDLPLNLYCCLKKSSTSEEINARFSMSTGANHAVYSWSSDFCCPVFSHLTGTL